MVVSVAETPEIFNTAPKPVASIELTPVPTPLNVSCWAVSVSAPPLISIDADEVNVPMLLAAPPNRGQRDGASDVICIEGA